MPPRRRFLSQLPFDLAMAADQLVAADHGLLKRVVRCGELQPSFLKLPPRLSRYVIQQIVGIRQIPFSFFGLGDASILHSSSDKIPSLIRHPLTSTLLTNSCASCSLKTNSFQGPTRTSCAALLPCPPLRGKLSPHTRDLSTAPSNVVYTKRTPSFRKFRSPLRRKRRHPPFFHAGRPTSH